MNDNELQRGLGRVEGKIDSIALSLTAVLEQQGALSRRVIHLETSRKTDRAFLAGISAAVSTLVTSVALFFTYGGFK